MYGTVLEDSQCRLRQKLCKAELEKEGIIETKRDKEEI